MTAVDSLMSVAKKARVPASSVIPPTPKSATSPGSSRPKSSTAETLTTAQSTVDRLYARWAELEALGATTSN